MGKTFSLASLYDYIADSVRRIDAVRNEAEEVEVGFNSAYVEFKAAHDAQLERLTESLVENPERMGAELRDRVTGRLEEEKQAIAGRQAELRDRVIPEAQAEADQALADGQALIGRLRELNPELNQREERLKKQRDELESALEGLNQQIRRLSGCFVVVFNFFKISRLDRERNRVLGQLDGIQQQLKEVREEWEQAQEQIGAEQTALQAKWQDLTLRVAQYQAELDYLSDKASREALAFKRATRYAIDHLVEELPSASPGVAEELDRMAELNRQTDAYEEGLGAVVSLLALLVGISEGLGRFNESVKGLVEEQRMHGAHLPKLSVSVPDNVLAFHEHWDSLAKAVRDDRHLSAHPADFVAAVQPTIEQRLDERDIRAMFEALGTALQRATASWKG